jgi:hypothetical protein
LNLFLADARKQISHGPRIVRPTSSEIDNFLFQLAARTHDSRGNTRREPGSTVVWRIRELRVTKFEPDSFNWNAQCVRRELRHRRVGPGADLVRRAVDSDCSILVQNRCCAGFLLTRRVNGRRHSETDPRSIRPAH